MENHKNKFALVMSGGGMRCSYSAGSLLALAEKFKLKKPNVIICASGSVGAGAYYISKQYKAFKKIWLNLVPSKKVLNFKRWKKILDIDYIVDKIFKKKDKLNIEKLDSSPINYLVASTNNETGKVEYFSNKDHIDILEAMRASMALPVVYNKIVKIKDKSYLDTPLSCSINTSIIEAIKKGYKNIIAIDNSTKGNIELRAFEVWLFTKTKKFRKNFYKQLKKVEKIKIPKDVNIILLRPQKELKINPLNNHKRSLKNSFDQGYKETLNNKELRQFLKNNKLY